jgi:hypothetical protein
MTNECGTVGGMEIYKGNRNNQRKPASEPIFFIINPTLSGL